jgi:hypothetical protein
MPALRSLLSFSLLFLAAPALGAPFYVESPGVATRDEAQAMMVRSTTAHPGVGQVRILRRYVRGQGWRYLVHVDDVGREKEARALAGSLGSGAVVVDLESGQTIVGATDSPVPPPPPPPPGVDDTGEERGLFRRKASEAPEPPVAIAPSVPPPAPPAAAPVDRQREAEGLLRSAARAHGGATGGLARVAASPQLTFAYTRRIPDADGKGLLVADHTFRRSSVGGVRLDVKVKKGGGVDSTTVVRPEGQAWVVVGSDATTRDSARAGEVVQRFGPEELLRVPLGLAHDLEQRGAWRGLQVDGPEGDMVVLTPVDAGPGRIGLVDAAVYRNTNELARVRWRRGSDVVTYSFADYMKLGDDLIVPRTVRIETDGVLVEEILVRDFDIEKPLPATLFVK